ncbi:RepA [Burkholderia gladioli]|uniref:RepA n=1 Tax=Burkholderia gladioli TaxID=28095 RepID=A0A2A7SA37_BURGA|nr:replication protein RepA [Burkholderia gladioli]PEH40517.1 RepA [Burkholderia gladioli]
MRSSPLQVAQGSTSSSPLAGPADAFDEAAYREKLIAAGVSPADAEVTARNTARARGVAEAKISEQSHAESRTGSAAVQLNLLEAPTAAESAPAVGATVADSAMPDPTSMPVVKRAYTRRATRKKEDAPLSKRQRALIEEALCLEHEEAGAAGATGYLARTLAQVTLPHTDPKLPLGQLYFRDTGKLTLTVSPTSKRHGIPYGSIPRVILAWICTEVVQTKDRTLDLGRSQADFLRKIGLHNNGHDIKRFRDQSLRLFKAVISVEHVDEKVDDSHRLMISTRSRVFWHPTAEDQRSLWASSLELTQEFYDEIRKAPVPIKMEVYQALTKAPFAMDIYTWLTYRMYVLQRSGRAEAIIPWVGLKLQFGAGYADTKQGLYNFKLNFNKRLREVLNFYREAADHVTDLGGHLRLTPCKPHVAPRS